MKKSLIYLLVFCFAFCLIFTACATKVPQNTDGSQSTESSQSTTETKTSATEETTESTSQQTTKQSTEAATTAKATTTNRKPYEEVYTKIRETKALQTEIPELQEKIDSYAENLTLPDVQQKFIVSFGEHRDVPYLYHTWHRAHVREDYLMIWDPRENPSFSDYRSYEKYMPTYTYTGKEEVVMEVNDEIYTPDPRGAFIDVIAYDNSAKESFFSFQDMYQELPKGKYYVKIYIEFYGNDIRGIYGYTGREFKSAMALFVLELK
jgi:hypothetical protein